MLGNGSAICTLSPGKGASRLCLPVLTRFRLGRQGWHSGESARLPSLWPRLDSQTRCHMWVEFVVGFRPCSEEFYPPSTTLQFQFDPEMRATGLSGFLCHPH